MYHTPVLLMDSVDGLNIKPDGVYVDVTFGSGGHSKEILKRLNEKGRLIGFDQDKDAALNTLDDKRFQLLHHNFKYLKNFLRFHKALPVDGILADLGVSSHQFDEAERGFSTRFDSDLDMRMNQDQEFSALNIVNEYSLDELTKIFREYAELPNSRRIASSIVDYRTSNKITTTQEFKEAIRECIDRKNEAKFLAKIFQALRIETNKELSVLKDLLKSSLNVLNSGGRLVVISYHSLEDRLVKNFMKSGNLQGTVDTDLFGNSSTPFKLITRKSIVPAEEEISENSRARSAKLRIAEKI
jgi:16S rRNA (cytosine1402-N4)-methyltransferase